MSEIEHREPIIVGFFILQYAKLRLLDLYYIFFKKFCVAKKYEELEKVTNSFYLDLSEEILEDIIYYSPREKKQMGSNKFARIVQIASLRMHRATSSRKHVVLLTRSMIRKSRDCLKKNSGVPKCCVCVAKPIVATIERVTSTTSVARDSIKELWKTVEMDPCQSIETC